MSDGEIMTWLSMSSHSSVDRASARCSAHVTSHIHLPSCNFTITHLSLKQFSFFKFWPDFKIELILDVMYQEHNRSLITKEYLLNVLCLTKYLIYSGHAHSLIYFFLLLARF